MNLERADRKAEYVVYRMVRTVSDHDPYDLDSASQRQEEQVLRCHLELTLAERDLVWLMSGPRGRRIVRRILRDARLDESSYHPNAMEMSRQEGRKEIARGLRQMIDRLCPELYVKMQQETDDSNADRAATRSHQTA
jgi:hypothetical protein